MSIIELFCLIKMMQELFIIEEIHFSLLAKLTKLILILIRQSSYNPRIPNFTIPKDSLTKTQKNMIWLSECSKKHLIYLLIMFLPFTI